MIYVAVGNAQIISLTTILFLSYGALLRSVDQPAVFLVYLIFFFAN